MSWRTPRWTCTVPAMPTRRTSSTRGGRNRRAASAPKSSPAAPWSNARRTRRSGSGTWSVPTGITGTQGPVYPLGGAFVDFLIRRYGVGRFVRLYNEGKPATFDAACRDIFGSDLDALEAEFWEDARRQVEGS